MKSSLIAALAALTLFSTPAGAWGFDRPERVTFNIDVLVDGVPLTEYPARGTTYVEALRGREYEIRITNPTSRRAAVALSVDGLNTIDASHTAAKKARKWVLEPYSSVTISGWQVSDSSARRFVFTGERQSYGAFLGQTDNLGVIEAVFFLERERRPPVTIWGREKDAEEKRQASRDAGGMPAPSAQAPSAQAPSSQPAPKGEAKLSDEYAATGMGDRTRHDVVRVDLELESSPAASVRIRYEFHQQLVKLGILPDRYRNPLSRREEARGFTSSYCPDPNR